MKRSVCVCAFGSFYTFSMCDVEITSRTLASYLREPDHVLGAYCR